MARRIERVLGAGMTECRIDDARVREPEHKLSNRYPWQEPCLNLKPLVGNPPRRTVPEES